MITIGFVVYCYLLNINVLCYVVCRYFDLTVSLSLRMRSLHYSIDYIIAAPENIVVGPSDRSRSYDSDDLDQPDKTIGTI